MTTKRKEPRLDLNPSSADRWTTCTASPRFILANWDKVPVSSDTVYNQEGTTAHEVAAAYLQGREPNPANCPTEIDGDMRWHGWNYSEYVEGLRKPRARVIVEQKLPLWYMKERNAIVDAAVLNEDSMHIVDFKYGEGVVVSPERNLQLAIYAMSVGVCSGVPIASEFPVFLHVYQPRGRAAEDGASHVWETTWLELCRLTQKISDVAQGIQDGTEITMFAPSEKACQWCPAKGFCVQRQKYLCDGIEVLATIDEEKKHFPPVQAISVKQLSAVLTHKEQIIKWLNDAEEYATEHLKAGHKLPGWKLVLSRGGNRYWSDPKKAAALLLKDTVLKRNEVVVETTIGPAAVEKLLGKGKLNVDLTNLIAKTPGAPVIAPESDKREALEDVTSDFEALP